MRRAPIGRAAVVLGWAVGLLLPAVAYGEDDYYELPESLRTRVQGDLDRQEIHALDFMLTVDLTREQAEAILPAYEQACGLFLAAYEQRAGLQPEMIEAFALFLEEDRLNQGFSNEVEARTARVNHRARQAREKHTTEMLALEAEVQAVLSSAQCGIARAYQPGHRTLAEKLARKAAGKGVIVPDRQQRRADPKKRGSPAEQDLALAKEELRALNAAIHPRVGPVGRHLLGPAAATPLYKLVRQQRPEVVREAVACRREGRSSYPLARCHEDEQKIKRLRGEISDWNLINGLHLDRGQIRELVTLIHRREHVLESQRSGDAALRLKRGAFRRVQAELDESARLVLSPGQQRVLVDFKPCLVPPRNLKDPVRVGQARDNSHLTKWLERARSMPGRRLDNAIERLVAGWERRTGPLDEREWERQRELIHAVVREAASMSEAEFALSRQELAERITPADRPAELGRRIEELELAAGRPGRTSRLLLTARMDPVLRQRYQQLGRTGKVQRQDLAAIPQAENCDKGCALRPAGRTR